MTVPSRYSQEAPPMVGSRRHTHLVDRSQQIRFGVAVVFYAFLVLAFFFGLTLYPPLLTLLVGGEEGAMQAYRTAILQFAGTAIQYWWISLLGFGLVGCASIIHSHRIFGPMRRFETLLWNKKSSPEVRVHCVLRRGDYFQGFSGLLEAVLNESGGEIALGPAEEAQSETRQAQPAAVSPG